MEDIAWRIITVEDKVLYPLSTLILALTVTFDQNGQNAISAEFGILAVSLPDWWFLRTKGVIGTFSQTVKAGIFWYFETSKIRMMTSHF